MNDFAAEMDYFEAVVDSRADGRVLKLAYEDLYLQPRGDQLRQVDAIWRFLGLPSIDPELIAYFLQPETAKLGSLATYGKLPNAREIDRVLGSHKSGWLFPELHEGS